jgi:hypothetical protein
MDRVAEGDLEKDIDRGSWEGYREEILCGTDLVTDVVSESSIKK